MRSFLLAAKISAIFLVVMTIFVSVSLNVFVKTVLGPVNHGEVSMGEAHHAFVVTVLQYFLVAIVVMIALSLWITAPLRRMRRSMDRIAEGDLEHRVRARGYDEVAAMGRSFNAMADRVQGMIVGQKELMASVSHELRSPLTRMKVSLELLRQGKDGERRAEELESEVDTVDGLVEELLLASRIDLGSVPLALDSLDLHDVCDEAWTRVAQAATGQGTRLRLQCSDDARRVLSDRGLAVRLFGNLFENAVRHAGQGEVTVTTRRRDDRIEVCVADQGPGVDEADLERLFEPFYRPDRSRSRRTGAGGLGLMIVQRAVEAHGGTVRAEHVDPHGLAVRFDLPRAPDGPGDFATNPG